MGEGVWRAALFAAVGLGLTACGFVPFGGGHYARAPHPTYKVGAPYTVNGITYYPHVDYAYDRVGVASWYGEEFQGRYTANGEVFDLNGLSAAHTTLPLPSIVEVINLENNRALRIRVNDRGPFARGRIIDLSRRAAQLLGFERNGTARVRVKILKEESIRAAAAAQRGMISDGEQPVSALAESRSVPTQTAATFTGRFFVDAPRYHVEAGPVTTEEDADRLRTQMIDSGYRDAHVVID
jgi:peptidoglycan lytic transglycosylase